MTFARSMETGANWVHDYVFLRMPGVVGLRALAVLIGFFFVSLVSRFAGAELAGDFFAVYGAVLIASSLFRLGADQYLIATLGKLPAEEQSEPIESMTRLVLACSVVGILAGLPIYLVASQFVVQEQISMLTWLGAGLCAALLSVNWVHVGALRGLGHAGWSVALETVIYMTLFLTLLGAGYAFHHYSDLGEMVLFLLLTIALSGALGRHLVAGLPIPRAVISKRSLRATFTNTAPFWLVSLLAVANTWAPIVLLGVSGTGADVTLYTLAQRLSMVLIFALLTLNARHAYEFARLYGQRRYQELTRLFRGYLITQLPFLLVVGIALNLIGPLFFEFSGLDDARERLVLLCLSLGTFVYAACGPVITAMMAAGAIKRINLVFGANLIFISAITLLAYDDIGLVGVCAAVGIGMAVQNLSLYWMWKTDLDKKKEQRHDCTFSS